MKVLHVLKSEPDETVRSMLDAFHEDDCKAVPLYEEGVDWDALLNDIFEYEKIICWW